MSGIIFERDYYIHIYETNLRKELTLPAMMRYFEEMALLQSQEVGVGFDYYQKHEVAWVLHGFEIKVNRIPRFAEKVTVRTQPVSTYKFMGFRKYWILDEQGNEMVSAITTWLFINPMTRRPMRVNDDMKQAYGHMGQPEHKIDLPEIGLLQRVDHKKDFPVRYSDIDVNRHVNNTHYVEWAMEALPKSIVDQCTLESIRIDFKKETSYPAHIESQAQVEQINDGYNCLHQICTTDDTLHCLLFTQWRTILE